jgi:hypothetical protein
MAVPRFQFGLLSLICLTAVTAGVLALLRPLDLPAWAHVVFAAYAIVFAAYIILRGIHMVRRGVRLRRQAADGRARLEQWIEAKRGQRATTKTDDQAI